MGSGVSIIIVNWNGLKWLDKLFDSIESQTYKKIEVIFVDNGSTDQSIEKVRSISPRTYIIENNRNLGFASANNIGIAKAKYENILLINTDTWFKDDYIELLLNELEERKLDVIAPMEADYKTQLHREPYSTTIDPLGHPIFIKGNKRRSFYLSGVSLLFKKAVYDETGGLDNNFFMYCEEVDWFWRLNLYGFTFDYSRNVYINHYGGGSSEKGLNKQIFEWRTENTLRMLAKNYSKTALIIILPIQYTFLYLEALIFLLILKKDISKTYFSAIKKYKTDKRLIQAQRDHIQKFRKIGDTKVLSMMYQGLAKAHHLKFIVSRKIHG